MSETWENLVQDLVRSGILKTPRVIRAIRLVPRHLFLPEHDKPYAAVDAPLPIGEGQTVSAPLGWSIRSTRRDMVSIMNEALEPEVGHKVLEVGAGCGWHSSTIAEIVAPSDMPKEEWGHVYTVEIIPELAELAKRNIKGAGYDERVTVICGDGSEGYLEEAPFDRVVVTAAAPYVPSPLKEQLKPGGVLVIPVGTIVFYQSLMRLRKFDDEVLEENLGAVAFVPLVGTHGHKIHW